MLDLICAPLTADLHGEIKDAVKCKIALGKRAFLIVPEQQTVLAEVDLASYLSCDSALLFEVTNFTRFANSTFRALGGIGGEACDKTRRALIMWRTLTELSGVLSMTEYGRDINAGMVDTALHAISEMQSEAVSADMLLDAATDSLRISHRRLWSKLSDLAKIYALYKKLLGERYSDSADELQLAIDRLREHPDFLSDTEIFIEGFTSFTEPQYRMICALSARTDVHVALNISKHRKDAFEYSETASAIERLKSYARRESTNVRMTYHDGRRQSQSETISKLTELIWQKNNGFANNTLQNNGEIRIFEAKTPFDECDFIAEDIKKRIMAGASYSDFAIVHGKGADIAHSLESSLSRHSIPAFLSKARDASSFEAIKLIYTAYSVILSGYRREDVISYAKCGLTGITREACDELELYVNTWQISGSKFTDPAPWSMNPDGYTTRRAEGTDEKLASIHRTRMTLISGLETFGIALRSAHTVREHAEALYGFLSGVGLEEALIRRADLLSSLGEKDFAEENRRLWKIICDALDVLVEVSSDLPTTAEAFLGQLKVVFSASAIGKIPAHSDEVTVGSADMLRLYEKKHVYLIGVNAGSFPAPPTDTSFFSEKDKLILSESGLTLSPELEAKNARELYVFMRAISYANDTVTFTYSRCNSKFKSIEPSAVISSVKALVPDLKVVALADLDTIDRVWFAEDALGISEPKAPELYPSIREALLSSGYSEKLRISEGDIASGSMTLGKSIRNELYGKGLSLTETRINSFTGCPFSYFCKYVLRLAEEKTATFDASGVGSFIHSILDVFIRTVAARSEDNALITGEEKEKLTRSAAEAYIRSLGEDTVNSNAMTRIKIGRLCRAALPVVDALCDELATSRFRPKFFELPIGREGGPDPINLKLDDGANLKVYGVIDRVDTFSEEGKTYLRVMDYKTGQKEFSPDDIDRGENLQMFLYLKSLIESNDPTFREKLGLAPGERAVAAGVIYVKTSVSDVKIDTPSDELALSEAKKSVEREGMVLYNDSVISAMDLRYTPLYSERYPTTIPESKRNLLYTEEGWSTLMEKVEGSLLRVAQDIRSGNVSATPAKSKYGKTQCEYCRFKPICRNAVFN